MLCVWWDQESVIYYELLKSGETVNAHRYHQQLVGSNCTVLCVKKGRIIGKDMTSWFSSTTTHHRTRQQWSKTTWKLNWEVLPHPAYSSDLAPSDYHLFSLMGHALSDTSILAKTSENGLMSGLPRKMRNFFGVIYTNCPKDGKNV